jgi:hypothetical protein
MFLFFVFGDMVSSSSRSTDPCLAANATYSAVEKKSYRKTWRCDGYRPAGSMLQLLVLRCVSNGVAVALWAPTTFLLLSACRFPCVHGGPFVLPGFVAAVKSPTPTFFWPGRSGPARFPSSHLGTLNQGTKVGTFGTTLLCFRG